MLKKLCIAAALTVASSAVAQDGPSYRDTLNFINDKISVPSSAGASETITQSLSGGTECTLSLQRNSRSSEGAHRDYVFIDQFNLADFDPSELRLNSRRLDLLPTELKYVVNRQIRDTNGNSMSTVNIVEIFVSTERDAQRVRDAFRHLIQICGGEEELF